MQIQLQFIFLEEDEEGQQQKQQQQQQQKNVISKGMSDFSNERPSMYNDHYLQGKQNEYLCILYISNIIK